MYTTYHVTLQIADYNQDCRCFGYWLAELTRTGCKSACMGPHPRLDPAHPGYEEANGGGASGGGEGGGRRVG